MKVKKLLSVTLVCLLILALLPGQVLALGHGSGVITGRETGTMTTQLAAVTTDTGPTLAEGNHVRWIDRIASPPQYALDFYTWLENNTDAALKDPTLGEKIEDTYVYHLHTLYKSTAFTYSGSNHKAAAEDALLKDLGEDHLTVVNYAGAVFGAFDRDHPEVFWLSGSAIYGYGVAYDYTYGSGKGTVDYEVEIYFYLQAPDFDLRSALYQTPDAITAAEAEQNDLISGILEAAPAEPYDQLAYFNQVLTERNCYNSAVAKGDQAGASVDAWKGISALRGSTGVDGPVCEGYARAYLLLCRAAGIPCVLVEGPAKATSSSDTIAHMWNYVQLEGGWYAVDTTWNDPYTFSQPATAKSGLETDEWFLMGGDTQVTSDMTFLDSHTVTNYTTVGSLSYVNGPVLSAEAYVPAPVLTRPTVSLRYPSLSFEDVIVMNVYYDATDLQDVAEMGLITYGERPEQYGVETADHVIPGYGINASDGLYYSTTTGIAPKDIGDTIYFAVYYKLTDGSYGYTGLIGYSPRTYAYNQLKSGAEEMRPLVAAMLSYGTAAQNYFDYKTDTPVNGDMTADQMALAEAYRADMIATVTQPTGDKLGAFVNDGSYSKRYPTVSFEGAFCINYYFRPTAEVAGDVTMYVWNLEDYEEAEVLTPDNATGAVTMTLTETGEYLGVVDGIAAKDLDKAVYVSFCYNDGTTDHCGGVIGYTIGLYCKSQAGKTGTLAELAAACAVYGYYAKQLFN